MSHPSPFLIQRPVRSAQQGMTLVEVMVGLALGLIVVGAILSTYLTVARTQVTQLGESQLSQNGESSVGFVRRIVREAGLVDPTSDLVGLNNLMSEQPTNANMDLFSTRNPDPANGGKGLNSLQIQMTGAETVLTTRREMVPANPNDRDCLGRTYPSGGNSPSRVVTSCLISFNTAKREILVQANTPGIAPSNPVPLVFRGSLYDAQLDVAQQPSGTLYNARSAAASGITYGGFSAATDWSQVVGLDLCLVIATATESQARATSYTRCDGTAVTVPTTGPALAFRTLRSVIQLRNRSAVMPFLTPEIS